MPLYYGVPVPTFLTNLLNLTHSKAAGSQFLLQADESPCHRHRSPLVLGGYTCYPQIWGPEPLLIEILVPRPFPIFLMDSNSGSSSNRATDISSLSSPQELRVLDRGGEPSLSFRQKACPRRDGKAESRVHGGKGARI